LKLLFSQTVKKCIGFPVYFSNKINKKLHHKGISNMPIAGKTTTIRHLTDLSPARINNKKVIKIINIRTSAISYAVQVSDTTKMTQVQKLTNKSTFPSSKR